MCYSKANQDRRPQSSEAAIPIFADIDDNEMNIKLESEKYYRSFIE